MIKPFGSYGSTTATPTPETSTASTALATVPNAVLLAPETREQTKHIVTALAASVGVGISLLSAAKMKEEYGTMGQAVAGTSAILCLYFLFQSVQQLRKMP